MKSLITLLFTLSCSIAALANTNEYSLELNSNSEGSNQIQFSQADDFFDTGIVVAIEYSEVETVTASKVVRLYKFKNSRIKKALAFKTKRNKVKIA
jgi:hypothetical protein